MNHFQPVLLCLGVWLLAFTPITLAADELTRSEPTHSEPTHSEPTRSEPTRSEPVLCPRAPVCGTGLGQVDCANSPYASMSCWPTPCGPAIADVIERPENMLYCRRGVYALCFYSGPAHATGLSPAENVPLPCTVSEAGKVADCTCKAFRSGPDSEPFFVDINAILNQGVYFETVEQCSSDGSGCKNIVNCGRDGSGADCDAVDFAPVCDYVAEQGAKALRKSLIPGADLVSAFSFAMIESYGEGSTSCLEEPGRYAGCMTAPCQRQATRGPIRDGELVNCACPTWQGPFQVGQQGETITCQPQSVDGKSYVWSASFTVPSEASPEAAQPAEIRP